MSTKAAITVHLPREEVERRWREQHPDGAPVTFEDAPGDRGTEIHLGGDKSEAKDALRRFKQLAETGEVPRAESQPDGEPAGV